MDHDALLEKTKASGNAITDAILTHPSYVINESDPDMQHAQLLQSEAYHIVHGMTSQYVDCKPKETCTKQYEKKYCEEVSQAIFQVCKKKLVVEIVPHETVTHYPLIAHLSVKKHDYAGVNSSVVDGHINFLGPKNDATFILQGRLPATLDCQSIQGSVLSSTGNAQLDYIHLPSCANGMTLDMHMSSGHKRDVQIDIVSKITTYETKDHWVDECDALSHDRTCHMQSQPCDVGPSTQVIQGIPVTRDCWQQTLNFVCRGGNNDGTCKPLQLAQCEQIGSVCQHKTNDLCTLYRQTYRCATTSCHPTTDVVCGNGKDYCLDGNCTDHSYTASTDFAKSVSALSAVADAGKNMDQSEMKVFTGHPSECSEISLGFSNCCTENGWGQDLALEHCSMGEKKLHVARENKQVIKVGRYCSGPEPFPCIEHNQVFCVFNSKLAKIIQEQGREEQLHINFGSAKQPNCSGLRFEELQGIDLAKIDFQSFFNEELSKTLKNQDPDVKHLQEVMQTHINQAMQTGKAHG
jgi:conjugal transfer mating pair stabilization protein TraN